MPVGESERFTSPELSDAPLHHALAEPHRRRLVAALREAATPLDTERLTGVVGLHANTVRWHLQVLEAAGIVERRRLSSVAGKRGRPRLGFTLVEQTRPAEEYRLLAALLAASLAGASDGRTLALEAGRSWGAALVDQVEPDPGGSAEEGLERLVRMLRRHGFEPELTADGIAMHACPYSDLALGHDSVVCATHQGIVEAALTRLRLPLRVVGLLPLAQPGTCVMGLVPAPPQE